MESEVRTVVDGEASESDDDELSETEVKFYAHYVISHAYFKGNFRLAQRIADA